MRIATGKVVHGKLELDGDSLEEGSIVTVLVPEADETFELTPEEEVALEESLNQAAAGRFVDAETLLRELRQQFLPVRLLVKLTPRAAAEIRRA